MRRCTLTLTGILAVGVAGAVAATPAVADTAGSAYTDNGGVHSGAHTGETVPPTSGTRPRCTYRLVSPGDAVVSFEGAVSLSAEEPGWWYEKWCGTDYFGILFITPRDPTELLEEARRYLPLPLPVPRLNPVGDQIVNLASWLWLDGGFGRETSSVSVPNITVTVVAVAESATWTMGDGNTVVCHGPGTAFDPTRPAAAQVPSCTHTYTRSSARQATGSFPVTVTVSWRAMWDVVGFPGGGALGTIDRPTTVAVRVGEVQAVNTPGT